MDAEKERREYILRKNQEREARLDTKRRNERSSIVSISSRNYVCGCGHSIDYFEIVELIN